MQGLLHKLERILQDKNAIRLALASKNIPTGTTLQSFAESISNISFGFEIEEGIVSTASTSTMVLESEKFKKDFILILDLGTNKTQNFFRGAFITNIKENVVFSFYIQVEVRGGSPVRAFGSNNYTLTEDGMLAIPRRTFSYSWLVGENYKYKIISL